MIQPEITGELPDDLYERIKSLCKKGDDLAKAALFDEALDQYDAAWRLVPDPKNTWEASTWILAAIADSCFLAGYNTSATEALAYAMTCPGGLGNPFLHLRYGQSLFDLDQKDHAADELMRAYMGGGIEIFHGEDKKYLTFLRSVARNIV
ncbi:hypothetical protein [Acetobacter sp. DsW_063]|uniref:hypothetical protein n=1 Tax=Acetobacter sp. DsW_063 TaxID=1514894 RepID=UPI000A3D2B0C|nr:hypothetical protein [Acetobacter sp. DsW_063]OUJ14921.1 hypothetical protein HK28_10870 [Acetobacter sp. DsW_063]